MHPKDETQFVKQLYPSDPSFAPRIIFFTYIKVFLFDKKIAPPPIILFPLNCSFQAASIAPEAWIKGWVPVHPSSLSSFLPLVVSRVSLCGNGCLSLLESLLDRTELVQRGSIASAFFSSTEITGCKPPHLANPGLLSKVTLPVFSVLKPPLPFTVIGSKFSPDSKDSNIYVLQLELFCKKKLSPGHFTEHVKLSCKSSLMYTVSSRM